MTSGELTTIYKDHNGMVERQAMRVLRDKQLAQDVAHEVFIHFINYAASNEVLNVTGLLHRMATQYAIRKIRATGRQQQVMQDVGTHAAPAGHDVDAWRVFRRALESCDEVRAQVAVHYFVDGMNQTEIAQSMRLTRRVIGRHLERFCEKAQKMSGIVNVDMDDALPDGLAANAESRQQVRSLR